MINSILNIFVNKYNINKMIIYDRITFYPQKTYLYSREDNKIYNKFNTNVTEVTNINSELDQSPQETHNIRVSRGNKVSHDIKNLLTNEISEISEISETLHNTKFIDLDDLTALTNINATPFVSKSTHIENTTMFYISLQLTNKCMENINDFKYDMINLSHLILTSYLYKLYKIYNNNTFISQCNREMFNKMVHMNYGLIMLRDTLFTRLSNELDHTLFNHIDECNKENINNLFCIYHMTRLNDKSYDMRDHVVKIRMNEISEECDKYMRDHKLPSFIIKTTFGSNNYIFIDINNLCQLLMYICNMLMNNLLKLGATIDTLQIILGNYAHTSSSNLQQLDIKINVIGIQLNNNKFNDYFEFIEKKSIEYKLLKMYLDYLNTDINIEKMRVSFNFPYLIDSDTHLTVSARFADNINITVMMLYASSIYNEQISTNMKQNGYKFVSYPLINLPEYQKYNISPINYKIHKAKKKLATFMNTKPRATITQSATSSEDNILVSIYLNDAPNVLLFIDPTDQEELKVFKKFYNKMSKHWPNTIWICLSSKIITAPNVYVLSPALEIDSIISHINTYIKRNSYVYSIINRSNTLRILVLHENIIVCLFMQYNLLNILPKSTVEYYINDQHNLDYNAFDVIFIHISFNNYNDIVANIQKKSNVVLILDSAIKPQNIDINKFLIEPITYKQIERYFY